MIKNILLFPYYLLAVFSSQKSFVSNPVIGSKTLNKLGLHVARILLAHAIYKIRCAPFYFAATKAEKSSWNKNGYILKENFLAPDLFDSIIAEVKSYNGQARQCIQGDTTTWRVMLDHKTLKNLPALQKATNDVKFLNLLSYTSARSEQPIFYIQQIQTSDNATLPPDPQKNLHSDCFHPTMKAWLFLEDVTAEKGAFTYVTGSNRLTANRLKWEYNKSIEAASLTDKYSQKGSFRANTFDLQKMGLPRPQAFAVKANTLVIANTNGFHSRGAAKQGATRLEIWAISRTNPFNPFAVGIGTNARNWLFKQYLQYQDHKAAKNGTKPSWHKVQGSVK